MFIIHCRLTFSSVVYFFRLFLCWEFSTYSHNIYHFCLCMVIDFMGQFSKLSDHFVSFFLYFWSYLRKQKVLCWSFIFHENGRVWQNIEIFMPTWPTQKQTKKHWIKCWDTRRRYISSFVFFFIYLFVGFALSVQLKMCA